MTGAIGCGQCPLDVTLTACMRKLLTILNAMLKHRAAWKSPPVVCA
jgi:hypothetical protein